MPHSRALEREPDHIIRITTPRIARVEHPYAEYSYINYWEPSWVLVAVRRSPVNDNLYWSLLDKGPGLEEWYGLGATTGGMYGRAPSRIVARGTTPSAFIQKALDQLQASGEV